MRKVNATGDSVLTYVVEAPDHVAGRAELVSSTTTSPRRCSPSTACRKVTRSGGVDRVIRVELDPDRLAALGISAGDVSQTLAANNVNQPGGRTAIGGQEQSVRTLASAPSVEALADTRIALAGAGDVKLSDLGTVVDSWEKPRQAAYLDGRQVVAFNIYRSRRLERDRRRQGGACRDRRHRRQAGRGASSRRSPRRPASSRKATTPRSRRCGSARCSPSASSGCSCATCRATLISAVAMPLSLIPTFAVMAAFDISLNIVTLLALSLVVGILVDDAIVEIENIVRHMRQTGSSAYEAAMEAADEIGLAVVATTATIVAVFVPVAFMPGIAGPVLPASRSPSACRCCSRCWSRAC